MGSIVSEEQKTIGRWKIPFVDLFIVKGGYLRQLDEKVERIENHKEKLEREFKAMLLSWQITTRQQGNLMHELICHKTKAKAPLCPKCGTPKYAGGIQWIDHAHCFADTNGNNKKAKI